MGELYFKLARFNGIALTNLATMCRFCCATVTKSANRISINSCRENKTRLDFQV